MKKAQIEIIGLLVIVILLSVSLLIALKFLLREDTKILESQRESIRGTSLMNTLFSTDTSFLESDKTKIRDLIKSCTSTNTCNNPGNAGVIIDDILKNILNNKKYFLIIGNNTGNTYIEIHNPISSDPRYCHQGSQNLITSQGNVVINLQLNYKFGLCQ